MTAQLEWKGLAHALRERPWLDFAVRRFMTFLIGVAAVVLGTFLMIHIVPGDPARRIAGIDASQEYVDQVRERLGLNDPLPIQFWNYVEGLFRFDLGTSFQSQQPVWDVVSARFEVTATLAGLSFLTVVVIALPLGMAVGAYTRSGAHRGTATVFLGVTSALAALPGFILAMILVLVFAVQLGWFPVAGSYSPSAFVLPVAANSVLAIASLSRIVRVQTNNVLQQDYIRTARSKRIGTRRIYLGHALPNLATTSLTLGGLLLTGLIGGTVVIENVFAMPGLGTTIVTAIQARDYPVIQAVVLILSVTILAINAIVDIALVLADPRSTIRGD